MKKQIHVYYAGRVQGVGFRYTAEDLALEMRVSGWVKNLGDGRVELVVEAEEDALKNFLHRIEEAFSSYIGDKNVEWLPATGEFKDFGIRF